MFGGRIWTDHDKAELPAQLRSRALTATDATQAAGEEMKARDPAYAGWER